MEDIGIKIKPIKTEADYEAVLKEIDRLLDAKPGTEQADRLDVLTTFTEAYEEKQLLSYSLIPSKPSCIT